MPQQEDGRPRGFDAFCGAGGATRGYQKAGAYMVGCDIKPQPRYVGEEFVEGDALELIADADFMAQFDFVHASPPCQAHTAMNVMWNRREHEDLIGPTRELLMKTDLPYIIENVPGAPLRDPVVVCGASLGLRTETHDLARHRLFEANWPLMVPPCAHGSRPILGVYGDHARDRRRVPGAPNPHRGQQLSAAEGLAAARRAMDMPWANWRELSQAIPPAYTELIGHQLMAHLRERSAA
jgi:DNA (cytosine-5)-methyltransferase 1